MSSTLNISSEEPTAWMPTSDIFAKILQSISIALPSKQVVLLKSINEALQGFSYLDVSESSIDLEAFDDLLNAVTRTFEKEVEGNTTMSPYELLCLSELKALLMSDPRAKGLGDELGKIVSHNQLIQQIPSRFMDLFLEVLSVSIFGVSQVQPKLSQRLLSSRVLGGTGVFDLSKVSNQEFCALLDANKAMYKFYGDGKGRISGSLRFFDEIAKYVLELSNLFEADPRQSNCSDS